MARFLAAMNATLEQPIAWTVALVAADPSPLLPVFNDGAAAFLANAARNLLLFTPTVTPHKVAYLTRSARSGMADVFALMIAALELATTTLPTRKFGGCSVVGLARRQTGAPEHEGLFAAMTR